MSVPRVSSGSSLVVSYLWIKNGVVVAEVEALDYWPPAGTRSNDGARYVMRGEAHPDLPRPTHERLESGEILALRRDGVQIAFQRTRRVAARD